MLGRANINTGYTMGINAYSSGWLVVRESPLDDIDDILTEWRDEFLYEVMGYW